MKKLSIICTCLLGFVFLTGCSEEYPQELEVYSFDTAVIQYQITGAAEGEETLYMRGDQKAIHRYVVMGDTEKRTLELDLGSEKYIADLVKMTAVKVDDADYDKLRKMNSEEQEKYLVRKELGLKEGIELPEVSGKTRYAGKQCDLYVVPNIGSVCVWNGIILMKEVSLVDFVNKKTVVSVETDVKIPAERFELPAGVIVTN